MSSGLRLILNNDILPCTVKWSGCIRAEGIGATSKPTPEYVQAIELCKSDHHKRLLLNNADFVPYLVDALLLDPTHPRAGLKEELKSWCQATHAECRKHADEYSTA